MTSVDLVVLGVMLLSGLIALMRGIVREVLSVAAWLGAVATATFLLPLARPLVAQWGLPAEWTDPVAYILLFLASLILYTVIARLVSGAVRSSAVGGIDRTLGFLFGLGRGAALTVVAYIIGGMAVSPDQWPEPVRNARALPWAYDGAKWVMTLIPTEYQQTVPPPPALRQPAVGGVINPTPAGRAIDPPPRR